MRLVSALDCQLRPPAGPMKQKMIRLQKGKIKIKVSLAQIKWSKEIFPFVLAAEAPASKTKRYIDNITLPHKWTAWLDLSTHGRTQNAYKAAWRMEEREDSASAQVLNHKGVAYESAFFSRKMSFDVRRRARASILWTTSTRFKDTE